MKGDPVHAYPRFLAFDRMEKGPLIVKATGQDGQNFKKRFGTLGLIGATTEINLRILGTIILVFLLVGSILVLWLFSLKKQVAAQTQSLELEIQERKKMETALGESKDKFLSLIANVPGYIAYVNADTLQYEAVNDFA